SEGPRRTRCPGNDVLAGERRGGGTGATATSIASPPTDARRRRPDNRPVDGSLVLDDRPAGRFSVVRRGLRSRRIRTGLPSLSRRLPCGLLARRLPAVRRVGFLSP